MQWIWLAIATAWAQDTTGDEAPLAIGADEVEQPAAGPVAPPPDVFSAPAAHRWTVREGRRGYEVYDDRGREVEIRRFAHEMGHVAVARRAKDIGRARATSGAALLSVGLPAATVGVPLLEINTWDPLVKVGAGVATVGGIAMATTGAVLLSNVRIRRPRGWYSEAEARSLVAAYNQGDPGVAGLASVQHSAPGPAPAPSLQGEGPWSLESGPRGLRVVSDVGEVDADEIALMLGDEQARQALQKQRRQRVQTGFGIAGAGVGLAVLAGASAPVFADLDIDAGPIVIGSLGAAAIVGGVIVSSTRARTPAGSVFDRATLEQAVETHNAAGQQASWAPLSPPRVQVRLAFGLTSVGLTGQF